MSQVVVSETWMPGWRAWLRTADADSSDELELPVTLVLENFQGVTLDRGALEARFGPELAGDRPLQLRMTFSPANFQIGFFASVIGAALIIFLTGFQVWRLLTRRAEAMWPGWPATAWPRSSSISSTAALTSPSPW